MKSLYIIGDSHSVAIAAGLKGLLAQGRRPTISLAVQKLWSSPELLKSFYELTPTGIEVQGAASVALTQLLGATSLKPDDGESMFACVMGFTTTKFVRRREWRRLTPWNQPQKGKTIISDGAIAASALHHNRFMLNFFRDLKAGGINFLVVSAPPLRPDEPAITSGVVPAAAALHIDGVARAAMLNEIEKLGIPFVEAPPEAFDPGGWLLEPMRKVKEADFHHANETYGAIMVERILAHVGHSLNAPQASMQGAPISSVD